MSQTTEISFYLRVHFIKYHHCHIISISNRVKMTVKISVDMSYMTQTTKVYILFLGRFATIFSQTGGLINTFS